MNEKTLLHMLKIANLLYPNAEERNNHMVRVLHSYYGEGLLIPKDWEQLGVEEQTRRLKEIVNFLQESIADSEKGKDERSN
jgi:hypothetical protein